jgi:hypothetical protein
MKTTKGILTAASLLLLAGTASAGYYTTINIDGAFADWTGVPVLDSDAADNPGAVDLAEIQMANDGDNLYIRATYHGALSLGTFIALDVDENTATGFDIFGLGLIGSEAGWQNDFPFTQSAGIFNDGNGMSGDYFGSGAALMAPWADSSSMEWAISLGSTFNLGGAPVFPDDSFNILLWTDAGAGDVSAPVSYTLAIPEPATGSLVVLFGGAVLFIRRRR